MWKPLLEMVADPVSGCVLEDLAPDAEWGRMALTCHFAIDLLCGEMHALSERGPPPLSPFFRESGDGLPSRGACGFSPDASRRASVVLVRVELHSGDRGGLSHALWRLFLESCHR